MLKKKYKKYIKYLVINKKTDEIHLLHFQKDVAWLVKVSERTLRRNKYYENEDFKVYYGPNVLSTEEELRISGQIEK